MKTILIFLFLTVILTASVDQKPKQFEVTFKVTYNSITLEKAAELEKIFRDKFKDACTVDVKIKEINNQLNSYGGYLHFYAPPMIIDTTNILKAN